MLPHIMNYYQRRPYRSGMGYYREQAQEVIEAREKQIKGLESQINNIYKIS